MESLAEIAKSAFVEAAGIEDLRRFDDLMGWHQAAWQAAADSVALPFLAEISQLRHDLLNEQAASRMAHEVVARNRVLEAENAQLRHALANAEVAAGFAKEMAAKVKVYRKSLELIATDYEHCEESIGFGDRAGAYRETARHTLESQP